MTSHYLNQVKFDICSKCGRRRPVSLMIEVSLLVYVCRKCMPN
jgi:hypothetical protein